MPGRVRGSTRVFENRRRHICQTRPTEESSHLSGQPQASSCRPWHTTVPKLQTLAQSPALAASTYMRYLLLLCRMSRPEEVVRPIVGSRGACQRAATLLLMCTPGSAGGSALPIANRSPPSQHRQGSSNQAVGSSGDLQQKRAGPAPLSWKRCGKEEVPEAWMLPCRLTSALPAAGGGTTPAWPESFALVPGHCVLLASCVRPSGTVWPGPVSAGTSNPLSKKASALTSALSTSNSSRSICT